MTARRDIGARELRHMLQARAGELVPQLCPNGQVRLRLWIAPNPTRADRNPGSFRVHLSGPKAGSFVDFAGVNAPFAGGGDRGDILDLIAYVACDRDRKRAMAWAKDWLGLGRMDEGERQRLQDKARARQREADARADDEDRRKRRRAFDIWLSGKTLKGTPGWDYLTGTRGLNLDRIPLFNANDIRFVESLENWWDATYEQRGTRREKVQPGRSFPAIVSAVRQPNGDISAVHCIFLAPHEFTGAWDKAPVAKPRLFLGKVQGGTIRVTADRPGAPQPRLTILGEGLEDVLELAEAAPEARGWACGSLGNLRHAPVNSDMVTGVIVARDNDWGKAQAMAEFEGALAALQRHGKPVTVISSAAGKDFNDLGRMKGQTT